MPLKTPNLCTSTSSDSDQSSLSTSFILLQVTQLRLIIALLLHRQYTVLPLLALNWTDLKWVPSCPPADLSVLTCLLANLLFKTFIQVIFPIGSSIMTRLVDSDTKKRTCGLKVVANSGFNKAKLPIDLHSKACCLRIILTTRTAYKRSHDNQTFMKLLTFSPFIYKRRQETGRHVVAPPNKNEIKGDSNMLDMKDKTHPHLHLHWHTYSGTWTALHMSFFTLAFY